MSFDRFRIAAGTGVPTAPTDPLRGGKPGKVGPVSSALNSLDNAWASGRKLLGMTGLEGSARFEIDNGAPALDDDEQQYPSQPLVILRTRVRLTPGCWPQLSIVALPGGWYFDGPLDLSAGAGGTVRIDVTVVASGMTYSDEIEVPASSLPEHAEPATDAWTFVTWGETSPVTPTNLLTDKEVALAHQGAVEVEIVVTRIGSPRLIDVRVHESPVIAMISDGLAADDRVIVGHTSGAGQPISGLEQDYPVSALFSGVGEDDTSGTAQIEATIRAQQLLGPVAFTWSPFSRRQGEGGQSSDKNPDEGLDVTSTVRDYLDGPSLPLTPMGGRSGTGFSYSRSIEHGCDVGDVMPDGSGVVPVTLRVYASAPAGTAIIELEQERQLVRLEISGPLAWYSTKGYAHTGASPADLRPLRIAAWTPGGGSFVVYSVVVSYGW